MALPQEEQEIRALLRYFQASISLHPFLSKQGLCEVLSKEENYLLSKLDARTQSLQMFYAWRAQKSSQRAKNTSQTSPTTQTIRPPGTKAW